MKKLILTVLIGTLCASVGMAQDNAESKVKRAFAAKNRTIFVNLVKDMENSQALVNGSRMEMTEEELAEAWENPPFNLASYLRLLGDSALNVKNVDWDDKDVNVHALLMQGIDDNDKELKVYQYLSKTFEEMYKVSPLNGSLDQYKEFYQVMGDVYPETVLGTIGVWATNNLFDVIPFGIENADNYYWRVPEASLAAYNVMGLIDEKLTPKMVFSYMIRQHAMPTGADGDIERLKNEFFGVWRNQPDPSLPCVKDADELESKLIERIENLYE